MEKENLWLLQLLEYGESQPTITTTVTFVWLTLHIIKVPRTEHIPYPSIQSSIAPVPHSEELPIPSPPQQNVSEDEDVQNPSDDSDFCNNDESQTNKPQFFTQQKLDDLIRELELTKSKAELLASCLKEHNLIAKGYKINKI